MTTNPPHHDPPAADHSPAPTAVGDAVGLHVAAATGDLARTTGAVAR